MLAVFVAWIVFHIGVLIGENKSDDDYWGRFKQGIGNAWKKP